MIRSCPNCGQQNRVPPEKLPIQGRCGACKERLSAVAQPLDVGPEEFRAIVRSARVPILVDFWAPWCAPCRRIGPEVARVAEEMSGKALVLKVNTDEHPELAKLFEVRGIPAFSVLHEGTIVRQQAGLVDHKTMQRWLLDAA